MDIGGDRVVDLMNDKGSYTAEAEICILYLLDYKVAFHHVATVIKAVSHLCNVQILKLPSEATVRRINTRRLAIAHMQIDDVLKNKDNLTLYSDETSKNGNKYLGMHVSDEENIYVLGLRDMSNKSSKTTLDTFKEIIQDICQSGSNTLSSNELISKIKNTMSDQAATEKCFNDLFCDYRKEILPVAVDSWDIMSSEEQNAQGKMYNFFLWSPHTCQFGRSYHESIRKFENSSDMIEKGAVAEKQLTQYCKSSESGVVRLARTACKALGRNGDKKKVVLTLVSAHLLKTKWMKK